MSKFDPSKPFYYQLTTNNTDNTLSFDSSTKENDNVNKPPHYTQGSVECIEAMEAAYGRQAVIDFCMCNAFKYQWRFKHKNGKEDILKAQWYQNKMLELMNKK